MSECGRKAEVGHPQVTAAEGAVTGDATAPVVDAPPVTEAVAVEIDDSAE